MTGQVVILQEDEPHHQLPLCVKGSILLYSTTSVTKVPMMVWFKTDWTAFPTPAVICRTTPPPFPPCVKGSILPYGTTSVTKGSDDGATAAHSRLLHLVQERMTLQTVILARRFEAEVGPPTTRVGATHTKQYHRTLK